VGGLSNYLSSADPVRVFQDFATLDLISGGRAEITAGRGSFTESFPLFGHKISDYDRLFSEKLELLLALRASEVVSWQGTTRPALNNAAIYPRPAQNPLPVWVAVGGTPQSVVRAATLGLPLAIAIIGGAWKQFAGLVGLYRHTAQHAGHDPMHLPISINAHGYIANDPQQAADEFFPVHSAVMNKIGRERGWPPQTRVQYEHARGPAGANFIGDPQQVIDKILAQHAMFGHNRLLLKLDLGTMPHAKTLHAIELYGNIAQQLRKVL
jgi:alkanesulfonate monooxygenase SsuD/methylene tetrahydromethanopterin reductase-like flavin-dependent oxidoreductase (luciferase family)